VTAAECQQDIPGFAGKAAVWIDVPAERGEEEGNKSKFRTFEAKVIANEIKKIMSNTPLLTVGIISFYAAQVYEMLDELAQVELVVGDDEGSYKITGSFQERIFVGTVDSFQGKEFDVVFLSMTRCNRLKVDENDEVAWRRKYGFLLLENRLNVAMSRAKKLLVVVGDAGMLDAPLQFKKEDKPIRGLLEFWKLTGREYGHRIYR
jgi:superfamily I DNA and/or RNA helicase